MNNTHKLIVFAILISSVLLISNFDDSFAKKAQGTKNPIINAKIVCGVELCVQPQTIEEKIKLYLQQFLARYEATVQQQQALIYQTLPVKESAFVSSPTLSKDVIKSGTFPRLEEPFPDVQIAIDKYPSGTLDIARTLPTLTEDANIVIDVQLPCPVGQTFLDKRCVPFVKSETVNPFENFPVLVDSPILQLDDDSEDQSAPAPTINVPPLAQYIAQCYEYTFDDGTTDDCAFVGKTIQPITATYSDGEFLAECEGVVEFDDEGAYFVDHITMPDGGILFTPGSHQFTCTATEQGATSSAEINLNIEDLDPPEIYLLTNLDIDSQGKLVGYNEEQMSNQNIQTEAINYRGGFPPILVSAIDLGDTWASADISSDPDTGALTIESSSSTDVSCTFQNEQTFVPFEQEVALGSHVVTCRAQDTIGNSNFAQFTVNVEDTTAPAFMFPIDGDEYFVNADTTGYYHFGTLDDLLVFNYNGDFIQEDYDNPYCANGGTQNSDDTCNCPEGYLGQFCELPPQSFSDVTYQCDGAPDYSFAPGTHPISCTATDSGQNDATVSIVLNVEELPPLIIDSSVIIPDFFEAIGPDGTEMEWPREAFYGMDPEIYDEDNFLIPIEPECNFPVDDMYGIGITSISCSLDSNDRQTQRDFEINVEDTLDPQIYFPPVLDGGSFVAESSDGLHLPLDDHILAFNYYGLMGDSQTLSSCVLDVEIIDGTCNCPEGYLGQYCEIPPEVFHDVELDCNFPRNDVYPIGQTTVSCEATDEGGNQATESFTLSIQAIPDPYLLIPEELEEPLLAESSSGRVLDITQYMAGYDPLDPNYEDNPITPDCLTPPGNRYPVGTTQVTCSVTVSGQTTSETITITIVEPNEPAREDDSSQYAREDDYSRYAEERNSDIVSEDTLLLEVPDDATLELPDSNGIVIDYTVNAYDVDEDRYLDATCDPASGSLFEVGETEVTCSATNSRGQSITDSFVVTLLGPQGIPDWIKTTTSYWVEDYTSDQEFSDAIEYLINSNIIQVDQIQVSQQAEPVIPSWIKFIGYYWTLDETSDQEFVDAIEYLISMGIIQPKLSEGTVVQQSNQLISALDTSRQIVSVANLKTVMMPSIISVKELASPTIMIANNQLSPQVFKMIEPQINFRQNFNFVKLETQPFFFNKFSTTLSPSANMMNLQVSKAPTFTISPKLLTNQASLSIPQMTQMPVAVGKIQKFDININQLQPQFATKFKELSSIKFENNIVIPSNAPIFDFAKLPQVSLTPSDLKK